MLTQKRLKELFDYSKETGIFIRKCDYGNGLRSRCKKGDVVGCDDGRGYLRVGIDGKDYRLHRLAFLFVDGYLPEHDVDHGNGIKSDTRWFNIEHVTNKCNSQNQKINSNNSSGFPGVGWNKKRNKWRSRLKNIHLGLHKTALDAALARITCECWSDDWSCNKRGELVKAVQLVWPEFNTRSIGHYGKSNTKKLTTKAG